MAEARVSVDVDQFKCPICLELLTDPVSINCGHSFCNNCIQHKWNIDANTGVYSCPLCRQKFSSRPALGRNVMLADMVARMRKMNLHTATRQLAEPDDEKCNVCTGKKYKAIKTCLVCLASYCEIHLNLHKELNPDNKHWVVDATGKLQDKICEDHNKLKDMYCCEDQKSVCVDCVTDHRGHRIIHSYYARHESQLHKTAVLRFKQRIQETEKWLKTLQTAKEDFKRSTQALEKDSEKPFKDLISFITRQQRVVKDMIKVREQKELQRLDRIQKQHQTNLVQLKNRTDELDQLGSTEDHIYFLQRMPLLYAASEFESPAKITVNTSIFKDFKESVSNIKTQVEELCKQEIKTAKTEIPLIRTSTPIIREDFLGYFRPLILDPKSAHKNLELSDDNTKLTWTDCENPYSDIPERFSQLAQALCMQGLSSCSYWEVEWGGPQVYIAVAYKGIQRRGCGSFLGFGHNDKSWSLCCSQSRSFICHDYKETDVLDQVSSRIGVFLDHSGGTLTFYSVSDNIMSLILQIKAKFTEPLYPGFWVFDGSYVRLCPVSENAGQPHTVKDIKKQRQEKCTSVSQFYLWGEH